MSYFNNYAATMVPSYPNGYVNPYAQQQQYQQLQQLQQLQQMQNPQQGQPGQPGQQGQQQQMQPMNAPDLLRGKKVTTVEEVKAMPIEFDGSVNYFPATDGKSIYTKQLNLDGTVLMQEYRVVDSTGKQQENRTEAPKEDQIDYLEIATQQNDSIKKLHERVQELEKQTQGLLTALGGK